MTFRFVTRPIHAYIDYPVALSLMVLPFILGLGEGEPLGEGLSVATGLAALVLTFLTKHETGVIRVLPYSLHLMIDRIVGVVFLVTPSLLDFDELESLYYWVMGAAILLVTFVFNAPHQSSLEPASA